MADAASLWAQALPPVKQGVTGVGVWAALNAAEPIALDNGVLVVGIEHGSTELAGHLRMPQTKRLVEVTISQIAGQALTFRVIEGKTPEDYEVVKRRDAERQRLQEAEMAKLRAELSSKTSWDSVYEQLSRKYAAVPQKSLPQNRARFFEEAVEIIAEARRNQEDFTDMNERNFARCIERVAQYAEVPSTIVAQIVLHRAGEI